MGWRERGEGGEECLLETEEEKKSYSARSLLKHGHPPPAPRQLRSSAFPAAEQPRAGPGHSARRLPPLHRPSAPFWSPWSQPLQLFGFSLYCGLSAIRAIYEREWALTQRGGKKVQNNCSPPFPHTPGVSSWVLLISDFSTPNPKLCILGWSREAGTPLCQTWRETSSRCCSPYEMHLGSPVQHKQCRWGPLHFQVQAQTDCALPGNCLEKS